MFAVSVELVYACWVLAAEVPTWPSRCPTDFSYVIPCCYESQDDADVCSVLLAAAITDEWPCTAIRTQGLEDELQIFMKNNSQQRSDVAM